MDAAEKVRSLIRNVPDFPSPGMHSLPFSLFHFTKVNDLNINAGIQFKDITPLLADGEGLRVTLDAIADRYKDSQIDYVAG